MQTPPWAILVGIILGRRAWSRRGCAAGWQKLVARGGQKEKSRMDGIMLALCVCVCVCVDYLGTPLVGGSRTRSLKSGEDPSCSKHCGLS